jgi:hypothetical protein
MAETFGVKVGFEEHQRLVSFLDTLAIMLGCFQTLNSQLPDATRPDVVRANTGSGVLFLGDAKNTETPNCSFTKQRLMHYVIWLSFFMSANSSRKAVFAICHNKYENSYSWLDTLVELFSNSSLRTFKSGVEEFDAVTCITWIQVQKR